MIAPAMTERWSSPVSASHSDGWRATRVFQVVGVGTPTVAKAYVMSAIPLNTQHPEASICLAKDFDSVARGFGMFDVTVNYQSTPMGRWPDPNNPLSDPTYWRWRPGFESSTADRDAYNNAIVNASGDAFPLGAVLKKYGFLTITARRNEAAYNPKTFLNYCNRVNKVTMTIMGVWVIGPGQMALDTYEQLEDTTNYGTYTPACYTFRLQGPEATSTAPDSADGLWDDFKVRILNQGQNGFWNDGSSTYAGRITQKTNSGTYEPVPVDVRLDATGKPLDNTLKIGPTGETPVANPKALNSKIQADVTADAVWLKYTVLPPVDFGELAL